MTPPSATTALIQLQSLWHSDFPLTQAMQVSAVEFDQHRLTTQTPLAPNTNTHGTAFAGSLYAIQALTAWGVLWLELVTQGLDGSIIHADGQIEFEKPIKTDITASCQLATPKQFITDLKTNKKAKLTLTTQVFTQQILASTFTGTYLVRLQSS